jgi:hypothetical protein
MAYVGQGIKGGTFSVLDTSGNTYNGSNVTFNLGTQVGSPAQLLVSHDGVIQKPVTDYTIATGGTQITFTTAPASGASIFITEISGAVGAPMNRDINGDELILDADADTSITADTDDQIDIRIGGSDRFKFDNSGHLSLLTDSGAIKFGADSDVTLTHDPDDGLFFKSAATADNNPVLLTLQTGETDMAADDVIGKISFQAPDEGTGTDAILVSAAVQAVAEGDHSSSSNATRLEFMTGSSEAATSKMSLSSAALLTVTDASPKIKILPTTNGNSGVVEICGRSTDGSPTENRTQIKGTPEGSTANTAMTFSVENASGVNERMRINSSGNLLVGETSSDNGAIEVKSSTTNSYKGYFASSTANYQNMRLYSDVGGTETETFRIENDGDVTNTNNSYGSISDERIKQDITDANSQWEDIKNLKIKNYKRKDQVAEGLDISMIGVVAQDLEKSGMSGLVSESIPSTGEIRANPDFGTLENKVDADGNIEGVKAIPKKDVTVKSVKYSVLYMKSIKALQEAITKIETLETEITALKSRVTTLEG